MRLPYPKFDALGRRPLRPRQPEHGIVIVRPEPIAEEACGHGKVDDLLVHLVKLHPSEPTGEDVFSQFCAEPALDFCPSLAWRALLLLCHGSCSFPFVSFAPLRTARLTLEQSTGSTRTAMTVPYNEPRPLALLPGQTRRLPTRDGPAMSLVVERPFEAASDVVTIAVARRRHRSGRSH